VSVFEPGRHIVRDEIVRRLGQGGVRVVCETRDTKLDRTVALDVVGFDDFWSL
jgi:hypothetical protein